MSDYIKCGQTTDVILTDTTDETCPAVGYQKASVCLPVNVTPFAIVGTTKTKCCGDPVIISGDTPCSGKKNGTCTFTISQTICVEVPVSFGATAAVKDIYVDCLGASSDDICSTCGEDDDGGDE